MPPKVEAKAVEAKKEDKKKGGAKGGAAKSTKVRKVVDKEPPSIRRRRRKALFRTNLTNALANYKNVIVVGIDNVGSNQLQIVRLKLRASGSIMLVGKNTVVRPVIREAIKNGNKKLTPLVDLAKENVAFVFTNSNDLSSVRDVVCANKVPASAKAGIPAPMDFVIPAGPTPLDPGQTNFFQVLNIATKITRGAIEIINNVPICKLGEKVTASAVALLSKLNIRPFFYGITVVKVYEDGFLYDGSVLDISKSEIFAKFMNGVEKLRFVSVATKQTNATTISNSLVKAHNVLLKIVLAIDYSFPTAEKLRAAVGLKSAAPEGGGDAPASGATSDKKKSASGSGSGSSSGSGSD